MSRAKSDPHERDNGGELFSPPPVTHLHHTDDPETSRKAAVRILKSGTLGHDQWSALDGIRRHPGSTCKELAGFRLSEDGDPRGFEWVRQSIGRRLNELEKAGLIHRRGERDGCSLWWPGRAE